MTDLKEALAQARSATASAKEELEKAQSCTKAVREGILAGSSTGDPIQDYLIVKFGVIDEAARERYVAINDKLKGKTGELIVIHYTERVVTKHRFAGPNDYEDVVRTRLAILTGDALRFSFEDGRAICSLPIDSYANEGRGWTVVNGTFDEVHEGKIFMCDDCGEPLITMRGGLARESWQPLNLVIGEAAVMAWPPIIPWQTERNRARFAHALEELGRLTLTAQEDPVEE